MTLAPNGQLKGVCKVSCKLGTGTGTLQSDRGGTIIVDLGYADGSVDKYFRNLLAVKTRNSNCNKPVIMLIKIAGN